jgi:hypothetical protein
MSEWHLGILRSDRLRSGGFKEREKRRRRDRSLLPYPGNASHPRPRVPSPCRASEPRNPGLGPALIKSVTSLALGQSRLYPAGLGPASPSPTPSRPSPDHPGRPNLKAGGAAASRADT